MFSPGDTVLFDTRLDGLNPCKSFIYALGRRETQFGVLTTYTVMENRNKWYSEIAPRLTRMVLIEKINVDLDFFQNRLRVKK